MGRSRVAGIDGVSVMEVLLRILATDALLMMETFDACGWIGIMPVAVDSASEKPPLLSTLERRSVVPAMIRSRSS